MIEGLQVSLVEIKVWPFFEVMNVSSSSPYLPSYPTYVVSSPVQPPRHRNRRAPARPRSPK